MNGFTCSVSTSDPPSQFMLAPLKEIIHDDDPEPVEVSTMIPQFAKEFEKFSIPKPGQTPVEHQKMVLSNILPFIESLRSLPEKMNDLTPTEVPPAYEGDDINTFVVDTQTKLKKELVLFTTSLLQTLPLICLGICAYHTCPTAKDAVDMTTSLQGLAGSCMGPVCCFLNTVIAFSKWTRAREKKMKMLTNGSSSKVPLIADVVVPPLIPIVQGVAVSNSSLDSHDSEEDEDEESDTESEAEDEESDSEITPATLINGQAVVIIQNEIKKQNQSPTQSSVCKQATAWLKVALAVAGVALVVCGFGALAMKLLK